MAKILEIRLNANIFEEGWTVILKNLLSLSVINGDRWRKNI